MGGSSSRSRRRYPCPLGITVPVASRDIASMDRAVLAGGGGRGGGVEMIAKTDM